MPKVIKIGPYWVYFWMGEGAPLEPIHVQGRGRANATKIWITRRGKCYLCNNNSRIPPKDLRDIMETLEARSDEIVKKWLDTFGTITYYC